MKIASVDERDAQAEIEADGFRVFIIRPGRRVAAYNIDGASVQEAFEWAAEHASGGGFSLAARFDQGNGTLALMYLTSPPETVMEWLDGVPDCSRLEGEGEESAAIAEG